MQTNFERNLKNQVRNFQSAKAEDVRKHSEDRRIASLLSIQTGAWESYDQTFIRTDVVFYKGLRLGLVQYTSSSKDVTRAKVLSVHDQETIDTETGEVITTTNGMQFGLRLQWLLDQATWLQENEKPWSERVKSYQAEKGLESKSRRAKLVKAGGIPSKFMSLDALTQAAA